jgi:hypothetical protein
MCSVSICVTNRFKNFVKSSEEIINTLLLIRSEFGRKYHPLIMDIIPYIAIGIKPDMIIKKDSNNLLLMINKVPTTNIKNNPSYRVMVKRNANITKNESSLFTKRPFDKIFAERYAKEIVRSVCNTCSMPVKISGGMGVKNIIENRTINT